MRDKEVKIEELTLRIPGAYENEAQAIGQDVMQQVADSLPASFQNRYIDTMNLKMNISPGTSKNEMTKLIAEAILKGFV